MSITSTPPPRSFRARSSSLLSTASGPSVSSPLARRPRPTPLSLSPMGSYTGTPSSYQNSLHSLSPPASARYMSFSAAGSNAGTTTTTATTLAGPTRFKRGHARKKAPVVVRTANPDELDLMALEDPDEVFRLFGVRDVRGLEKRAKDAADAKVAELRTMVGERYRDLLSAADSIVRMRGAAEKLVDCLEQAETGLGGVEGDTPSKRAPKVIRRASTFNADRTLASPPTLSLTMHLFLSLPSLVHTLLESSSFLPAARLEGVGRVVYRELSSFSYGENEEEGGLKEAFPIIERQWESVGSLGTGIARRATAELRLWEASPITTAQTLAAIVMLENSSLPSALCLLLEARSKSLSAVLDAAASKSKTKRTHEIDTVLANLNQALGIVLHTFQAAITIFGASPTSSSSSGLLLDLLHEIEAPSGTPGQPCDPAQLPPTLSTLPNYALLDRHLPPSILSFTPFLSPSSPRNALSPIAAHTQLQTYLTTETTRVVTGVRSWISDLRGGARTLSRVRTAVREALAKDLPAGGEELRRQLEDAIEERLATIYRAHLAALVERIQPCLRALLVALPASRADRDPAHFLFEVQLPFPSPAHYVRSGSGDPFEGFLEKVGKRVGGRSPLIDRGLGELEAHARELREDMEGWLEGGEGGTGSRVKRRERYVHSAGETFDGVFRALSTVLDSEARDVEASLFIGTFAFMLSTSKTFTRDLLLGSASIPKSQEGNIVAEWQARLTELQSHSLATWRLQAVEQALGSIENSMNSVAASAPSAVAWAWEESRGLTNGSRPISLLPGQPSTGILASLRHLVDAARQVVPHRTQADPEIIRSLVVEFEARALPVAKAFVGLVEALEEESRRHVATQAAWDVVFLQRFWGEERAEWKAVEGEFIKLCGPDGPALPRLESSTLHYLQRTQTIFFALLPPPSSSSATPNRPPASRLLAWGVPPAGHEFKSSVGVVRPRARLGLLRE